MRDVKEPTHDSRRVGHEVSGVVAVENIADTAGKPFRQLNPWINSKYTLHKQSDNMQLQAAANNKFSS